MLRYIVLLVSVSVAALGAVSYLRSNPQMMENAATAMRSEPAPDSAARPVQPPPLSGTERLQANRQGHYVAEFALNSSRVTGVIDTGATTVAMGRNMARRVGLHLTANDFVYQVSTANGVTSAARVVLDEVRIGSIRVRDVEAMVVDDESLDIVLIGMTFLNRLKNFQFSDGMLEMKS